MSYVITGLSAEKFMPLYNMSDAKLEEQGVIVQTADTTPGYPCRVTLEDAEPGERVFLLNYESHHTPSPYRSAYAIYVRQNATKQARYENDLPPIFINRPIALRVFDVEGMLIGADMGLNNELDDKITTAFDRPETAYIHAHNAMHGCFVAAIARLHEATGD